MTLLRTAADRRRRRARALATATAEQAELVRAQWTAAAQRTKGLERLRDRHREALRSGGGRPPRRRAVDDLVTGRAGRAPRDPATTRTDRGGAVDGVTAVQTRIAEIQARFDRTPAVRRRPARRTGRSAASAAGLAGHHAPPTTAGGATGDTASEAAVVAEAQKYLGVPYLWGGTDPSKGLDCSGFTQLVFGNLGIDLPRDVRAAGDGRPAGGLAGRRAAR